ncbi:MAG: hypothetical protein IJS08_14790 [Victivallales bacterium]|nr:hypothetical protein [Victivallales bacterium]
MADYTNVVISGTTRRVNAGDTYSSTTVIGSGLLEIVGGSAYDTTLTDNGRLWLQGGAYASGINAGGSSCRISAYHNNTVLENVRIESGVNATVTWRLDIRPG